MITNLIDLLQLQEFYGVSERVDIAKGKYEYPWTWKQGWKVIKRRYYGRNS
ncbi:MAG: hypothetical protein RLY15_1533 [Bacteroidota bacterium]|jgi:hypothetical protein